MSCELCELVKGNIITKLWYRNDLATIVDCATCNIPMLVFNHCGEATERERRLALARVNALLEYESIRTAPRKVMDHEHWHIIGAKYIK